MHQQILPAVAAIIFNEAGEVLLQKRNDVNEWGIISGHVEFGESIEQAIVREIKEETNADAEVIKLIGVYSSPASQTYHYKERTVQYVTSYFEAKLKNEVAPDFCNDETGALGYFPINNLPGNFAQINPAWLTDALTKQATAYIR